MTSNEEEEEEDESPKPKEKRASFKIVKKVHQRQMQDSHRKVIKDDFETA